jgi:hypothetical protein
MLYWLRIFNEAGYAINGLVSIVKRFFLETNKLPAFPPRYSRHDSVTGIFHVMFGIGLAFCSDKLVPL